MRLLISEVLQKVSNAKTKAEKIKLLHEYNTQTLRSILIWNFDESVKSLLPEGEVPYTPNEAPAGTEHTLLEQESKRFYYFVANGNANIPQVKRETMFIQMLEGLHSSEAELMVLTKDKKLGKKYKITRACVEEAFPQIVWGNRGA
jgi:hypothetical protein